MNKQLFFGVVCAVLVLAVVSSASAGWFDKIRLGPGPSSADVDANAAECTLDDICEVNAISGPTSGRLVVSGGRNSPGTIKLNAEVIFANLGSNTSEGYVCNEYVRAIGGHKLFVSPVPCLAISSEACGQFSGEEVVRVIRESSEGDGVVFRENTPVYKGSFVTVPAGLVLEVITIYNSTDGFADDYITLRDPIAGTDYQGRAYAEGVGTIILVSETYGFNYFGAAQISQDDKYITLDYPQSLGQHRTLDLSVCF